LSTIYTTNLWTLASAGAGNYFHTMGVTGQVIVIKDMAFTLDAGYRSWFNGFKVLLPGPVVLWERLLPDIQSDITYQWEGRGVLAGGSQLEVTTLDDNWHWHISGFVLTP
jgi:hypothetical protein